MTRSKLSKKQRAAREALLKEQRAIKKSLKQTTGGRLGLESTGPVCARPVGDRIASRGTGVGNATLSERPTYTGDKMIGIGQLHKSNAVPVFRQEDAEDIARMRR
jgi:hypothetical protein